MRVFNTQIYGLEESIIRSGYPMLTEVKDDLYKWSAFKDDEELREYVFDSEEYDKHVKRAVKLANAGAGHNNFLKGVLVQMDVEAPQYAWMQMERYQFFTIISSQSKMHRLMQMSEKQLLDVAQTDVVMNLVQMKLLHKMGHISFDEVLDNVPMGLELTAGISTNYLCLRNMYHQRKNHRLAFWKEVFCPWVESLPMANELIIGTTVA